MGRGLSRARPMELAIGNIVRRILFIIREEFASRLAAETRQSASDWNSYSMQPSLGGVLASVDDTLDYSVKLNGLMEVIMTEVNELVGELETVHESIMDQAVEHISEHTVVLTCGESRSVEMFIRGAAKKRRFRVFVVETAPSYGGQIMAKTLAEAGIDTTLIPDTAVFAIMARVDKVLLPTHTVMADGGLIAPTGTHVVALSAKTHAVPVLCITGLFKLCPVYPHDLDAFNELASPEAVLGYDEDQHLHEEVEVLNPEYDYIPPELLDLYVTNTGGHQPSYIYRLLAECYHPEDQTF